VNSVVKRTLQVVATSSSHGCELATDLTDDLPLVRADAEQLRQVLMNLVMNAIQAVDGRGRVEVATRERSGRPSTTDISELSAKAEWIEISVSDNGPGITPQVKKNLFVPFFTTKDKGTGLGLAISERMVVEMGGRIEVSSQAGSGSTFTVLLPAVDEATVLGRPASQAPPKSDGTRTPEAVGQSARSAAAANETVGQSDPRSAAAHEGGARTPLRHL
jgi:signal transduction histidine kinase